MELSLKPEVLLSLAMDLALENRVLKYQLAEVQRVRADLDQTLVQREEQLEELKARLETP